MQKTLSIVDLKAIRRNAQRVRGLLGGKKFFAVVKADGYGHGAEEVARYIEDIVDGFCVAICDEGAALRIAGVTKPTLVFTPPLGGDDARKCAFYGLEVTVNSLETAAMCKGLPCHIKVNTGMNRAGCSLRDIAEILSVIPTENVRGVYSHLYAPEDAAASFKQLSVFGNAEKLVKAKAPNATAHLSASGGLLRGGAYLKDGARAGILLYGYAPAGFTAAGFEPALKVYARKVQTTRFIGGGVGYNKADRRYSSLSLYRLGYADGFSRNVPLGEKTLCMDYFLRTDGEELRPVMVNAEAYARASGTISYEALTSVTKRSERVYER